MTTVQQIYEEMQRIAPLALAESWDNPGLLVDCGGGVSRVLVTLDITPEVVEEAARKGCGLIVSHHPVIFSPLKKLSGQDAAFRLVKNGISAICMHTNLDAAEGGVNEVLAGIFGMREMEAFAEGCGRVGSIEPITVPELAKKAQKELAFRCNQPFNGPAVQVKFADTGKTVRRLGRLIRGGRGPQCHTNRAGRHQRRRRKPLRGRHCAGGGLPADRRGQPPPRHRRKASGALAHRSGPLRYGVPGDGGGGGEAAHGLSGAGSPCERGCPGSLYLFIKRGNTNGIGCRDTGADGGGAEDHAG